jgi:type II secretory pathway component PulM
VNETPKQPQAEPATRSAPRRSVRQQAADLGARFAALPPRQRWAIGAVAVLLGFLAVDDLLWTPARNWAGEADRIAQALQRGARRSSSVTTDLKRAVGTFGAVEPPGDAARGREQLAESINEVAKRHKVSGYSYEARVGSRLKDPDAQVLGPAIDRLQAEVRFETTAEELPALVADLESHPGIELVSALRITRNEQSRKIAVQATIEAWTLSAGGRQR